MEQGQLTWIATFIWSIADDVLRDLPHLKVSEHHDEAITLAEERTAIANIETK